MVSTAYLAQAFVEMTDALVDGYDVVEFLGRLAEHAALISGAEAVGVLLADHEDRLQYLASSNESGPLLELCRLQHDEGPCWDCCHSGTPVVTTDLSEATGRWTSFAPAALATGFRSVHALPLRLRGDTIGALGIFGTADIAMDGNEVRVIQALADVATVAILQERAVSQAQGIAEQLQSILRSGQVIEQAKGAIAQRTGLTPDGAFEALSERAASAHVPVVDLADAALETLETDR